MRGGETRRVAARVRALLGDPAGGSREDDVSPDPAGITPGLWQRLAARVPVRLDPGRRAALGVGLAVLVAAIATGLWLISERPQAVALSAGGSPVAPPASLSGTTGALAPASAPVSARPQSSAAELVVVDVAGKVRHPGLYRLPPGSRVDDAVRAAGGPLPGTSLTSLNLAAKVGDGQQVVVGAAVPAAGVVGSGGDAAGASAEPGGSRAAPVSLNSGTLDELETLPGVGPVLAQHILDWRAAHGRFDSVAQLNDVPGIGDVKFAALKSLVTT